MGKVNELIQRLLGEPARNLMHAMYDDYVEANVRFRSKSGIKTLIIRRQLAKCCDWCAGLAGIYESDKAPDGVYQRHDNCKCMVTFRNEKGKYTDVWSKKEYDIQRKARIARQSELKLASERSSIVQFVSDQIINLHDEIVGRSIGARANNYDILDLITGERYHLAEGTKLTNKEVFAGKGKKTPYRNAWKYAEKYPGTRAQDWQHVKGIGIVSTPDGDFKAEIHWSQCEGVGKVDMFVKKWLE